MPGEDYFERPVFFGPFMENFKEMADEFKRSEAAVEVKDAAELEERIMEIAKDPERARSMGEAAKELVMKHQGATDRSVRLLQGAAPVPDPVIVA